MFDVQVEESRCQYRSSWQAILVFPSGTAYDTPVNTKSALFQEQFNYADHRTWSNFGKALSYAAVQDSDNSCFVASLIAILDLGGKARTWFCVFPPVQVPACTMSRIVSMAGVMRWRIILSTRL